MLVECRIMINIMVSATEAEMGELFENCQKSTSKSTALAEMGHLQPPTPVVTDNRAENIIDKGTAKKNIS